MMLKIGRKLQKFLLVLVIVLVLYGAYRMGFSTEAIHDRVGKCRMSGNVNYMYVEITY